MIGTWMQVFAQGWVLTSLTSRAVVLAWITFAAGIPTLLLTLLGGTFADRYDKRRILFCVLLVQIGGALYIGILVMHKTVTIAHVFAAATILGISNAFEVPSTAAFVPELVTRAEISKAIAIDRVVFHFTRLVGPAVGGWMIWKFDTSSAYLLNALSFLPLMAAILTTPPREVGSRAEEEKRGGGIGEGIAYVRRDPPTRRMILLMASMTLCVSPFLMILMPLYTRQTLHLAANQMGVLMGISGAGSLAGSLGLLSIPKGHRAFAVKAAVASTVAGLCGLAWTQSLLLACVAMVLMTIGLSTCFGLSNIIIQERAPENLRGRVSAVASLSFFGMVPFSGLLISSAVDWIGMRSAMACGAGTFAFITFLLLARVRTLSAETPAVAGAAFDAG